jgi:hypothetical protein
MPPLGLCSIVRSRYSCPKSSHYFACSVFYPAGQSPIAETLHGLIKPTLRNRSAESLTPLANQDSLCLGVVPFGCIGR